MKNNILFFTFFVFAMITHMQAQQFNLNLNGDSHIYSVTINDLDQWDPSTTASDLHIGDDERAHDWNKNAGNYELAPNSNAYAYAGFYGYVLSVTTEDDGYSYGNRVILRSLDNNKFALLYAHLSEINVQKGDIVHPGDKIGKVGISGLPTDQCNDPNYICSHLHLALWKNIDNPTALANMKNGYPPSGNITSATTSYPAPFFIDVPVDNYQTPTNTVNITSPANNTVDIDPLNAELDWDVFTGADKYFVQVSTQPDTNPNTGGLLYPTESVYSNLYSAHRPNLQGNTTYYWTVKPVKNSGAYIGDFSPIRSFTTGEDTRPNIFGTDLRVFDESDTNEITEADIGEYITVKLNQYVEQPSFEGLGSYVNFYISTNSYLDSYDVLLGTKYANITPELNPKLTKSRLRLPGYTPDGNVYLIAQVDSQKVHQESNENDNVIVIPITLNKVKPFIITQSVGSIKVEFYAPHSMKLLVVMSSVGHRPFSRTLYGWHKTVHASRCYQNTPIQFSRNGDVTISLYQVINQYNRTLLGTDTVPLIPIDNNCNEIPTQSERQSNSVINGQTYSEFLASELMEVQIMNLSSLSTKPITKLVDKSTFDIKSLNLPKGFYSIRFADGTTKKVYLK